MGTDEEELKPPVDDAGASCTGAAGRGEGAGPRRKERLRAHIWAGKSAWVVAASRVATDRRRISLKGVRSG